MMTLQPLFGRVDESDAIYTKIKGDSATYETSDAVVVLADKLAPNVSDLVTKDIGKLTFAAYVLLETLHRSGNPNRANELLGSLQDLMTAAWYCAIGIEAGRQLPKDVTIETVKESEMKE